MQSFVPLIDPQWSGMTGSAGVQTADAWQQGLHRPVPDPWYGQPSPTQDRVDVQPHLPFLGAAVPYFSPPGTPWMPLPFAGRHPAPLGPPLSPVAAWAAPHGPRPYDTPPYGIGAYDDRPHPWATSGTYDARPAPYTSGPPVTGADLRLLSARLHLLREALSVLEGMLFGPMPTGPAHPPLPLPHDLMGSTAYHRVNLPWFNFGVDFGTTAWGDMGIANNPEVSRTLDELKGLGAEDIIMWTVPDGRNVRFDVEGTPVGLAPGFERDMLAFLDQLSERGMSAELVMIDGNTWCLPEKTVNGLTFQGHGDVITDPTGKKQQAFDENVLGPILEILQRWRSIHPDRPFPVSGINMGNELIYGLYKDGGNPDKNVTQMDQMVDFVRGRTAFIHRRMPGLPVTVGSAHPEDLFNNWLDARMGSPEARLDYYTFHHYGTESLDNMATRFPWASLGNKAVHLGEFPGTPIQNGPQNVLEYYDHVSGVRGSQERAYKPDRFLRSAAMWAARHVDHVTPVLPSAQMVIAKNWYEGAFAEADKPPSTPGRP